MITKKWFRKTQRRASVALAIIAALLAATGVLAAAAGALDTTFDYDGKVVTDIGGSDDPIRAMVIQPDGKIVVAGYTNKWGGYDFALARYNSNGSLDTTFDWDGIVITDIRGETNYGLAIARQSDGKIVVAGMTGMADFALARYNSNGSLDSTFDGDGIVVTDVGGTDICYAVAIQSDGKIVVAGVSNNWGEDNFALARYNTNGSLDTTFDYDGKVITSIRNYDVAHAMLIQPDGKIVAAGTSCTTGFTCDFSMARYNSDGSLDASFDGDGKVVTDIRGEDNDGYAIALQSNGRIVLAGMTGTDDFALVRYNSNGSPDATFDGDGIVVTDFVGSTDMGYAVAVQLDGKIVMAGRSNRLGTYDLALTRYNVDGSLDTSFDGDGKVLTSVNNDDTGHAIALQTDGKIVVAGVSDGNFTLARYHSGGLAFSSAGAQDGWVLESTETSNVGGSIGATGSLRVGDDAANKQYRSILSFNTYSLPDNATITKVTLKIKKYNVIGTDPFTTHGNLIADIRKGVFGVAALEITDFQAAASKNNVGSLTAMPGAPSWYQLVMGAANYTYINKFGMTQFRLRFVTDDNNDGGADYVVFYAGDSANISYRPTLIIEYTVP